MKKQLNKIREMAGVEIGRRSAGRANRSNKMMRRKEDSPAEWKGFSMREFDEACYRFFRSRGMPLRSYREI